MRTGISFLAFLAALAVGSWFFLKPNHVNAHADSDFDRQALATLMQALAVTPRPPALRDRELVIDIPVVYELKGAN